jgi:CSLREA domain-containing protein
MLAPARTRSITVLSCVVLGSLGAAAAASAASFLVTRTDDPTPGACVVGDCSLREAVVAANASPGSVITIPAGTYTLTIPGNDDASTNPRIGDVDILAAMTLNGAGSSVTIVQSVGSTPGGGNDRIFDVSGDPVRISGMTIRNGYLDPAVHSSTGGCIRNGGVLTLDFVVVTGCVTRGSGGGIASYHLLNINNSTIIGNRVESLTGGIVTGGGVAGGVSVSPNTVNISGSLIANNTAASGDGSVSLAYGAGFANVATMNISYSQISGNVAHSSAGGINTGTMTILRSSFIDNKARFDVGGVDNDGTMTINESTFSGNVSGFGCVGAECDNSYAGGVLNTAGGTMYVNNSTLSGNSCLVSGGGIANASGTVTISSSTIVGNTCGLGAGVTAIDTLNIKNTIVANNPAFGYQGNAGGDCSGQVTSQGYNMITDLTGCLLVGDTTGNMIGVDPSVGPLLSNGGYTNTRALNPGSPAFNAGHPGGCRNHAGSLLTIDQRGYLRPSQGRCDIGAFELPPSVVLLAADNSAMAWSLNGATFVGNTGFSGPGPGWTATSYSRNPNESYHLLWSTDNAAHLWGLNANNTFAGAWGFSGPGPGWTATSYFRNPDGSYHLLWTTDNLAHVWTLNADHTFGGAFGLSGPGAGWAATSYFHAPDGSHRVLWSRDNLAHLWTITPGLTFGGATGLSGPGSGWTAASYHLNPDGSWNVAWTRAGLAHLWTINANGSFGGVLGMGFGGGWTVQSYFNK